MRPFFPALLLALFAGWCGTLGWGATGAAATVSVLALGLAVALGTSGSRETAGGGAWTDPLRLGPFWAGLPWLLLGWCILSSALSPVPRSGRIGLLLLPAFLLLPAIVARCLSAGERAKRALRAVSLGTGLLSLWALADWLALGAPRPAMPLGHHNLLAACLVALLPLSLAQARERGRGERWRRLGCLVTALALGTIFASRSLAGWTGLGVQGLAWAWSRWKDSARPRSAERSLPKRRTWIPIFLGGMATLAIVWILLGDRLGAVARGVDPSLRARETYWRAGVAGVAARPWLGWGPGSTPWTLAAFWQPVPGVNPPGEEVGDLHDLPLTLAYELGAPGVALVFLLVWRFGAVRRRERAETREGLELREPENRQAGLLGLLGLGVASLGGAPLAVTALPVVAALAAGFALGPERESPSGGFGGGFRLLGWGYPLALAVLSAPILLAHLRYDEARRASFAGDQAGATRALARAASLDGSFPLYRWRLGLLRSNTPSGIAVGAEEALRAARAARGVPVLWETASLLGLQAGRPWAAQALARASALAPMSALPPFHLAISGSDERTGIENGARAILAEPKLAWACAWRNLGSRREAALEEVLLWPGVDAGWRETLVREARRSGLQTGSGAGMGSLALTFDAEESSSTSLLLFHRRGWPARWPLVPLCPATELSTLPPAWALPTTSPGALRRPADPFRSVDGQILLTE